MSASIMPFIIVLGVGQMAAPCMETLPPFSQRQQNQPQACPPGLVTISKGHWVAQGTLDAQTQKMQLRAGPWQTRGEQCEHCQRTLPTTCVGDYQGSHMIQTESGPTRIHVFRQTHWLPVGA